MTYKCDAQHERSKIALPTAIEKGFRNVCVLISFQFKARKYSIYSCFVINLRHVSFLKQAWLD